MLAISSFSKEGYERYGKDFLSGFKKYWPGKLFLYTESPTGEEHENIMEQNFFDIEPTQTFYHNIQNIPKAHGKTEHGYNYNYDLWKFSRKVFAQWDVLKTIEGKVFWLDADIVFKDEIPEEFLENLFNGKGIVTFMRPGWHSETGIVGFDTTHPRFDDFLNIYIGALSTGVVFELPRWHDCEILDFAIRESGIDVEDLSKDFWVQKERYKLSDLKCFPKSVLAPYMTHRKGNKKK